MANANASMLTGVAMMFTTTPLGVCRCITSNGVVGNMICRIPFPFVGAFWHPKGKGNDLESVNRTVFGCRVIPPLDKSNNGACGQGLAFMHAYHELSIVRLSAHVDTHPQVTC